MVKNPPTNAGDVGLIPVLVKIPHASEQLYPCTTTTESGYLEPKIHNKRSHSNESVHHN